MGGNIFDNTTRLTTERLEDLERTMAPIIHRACVTGEKPVYVRRPHNFKQKTDHGDLDLLVGCYRPEGFVDHMYDLAGTCFPYIDAHSVNGDTTSFRVRWNASTWYQMDVEFMGPLTARQMDFCLYWHSYGGLGNLLGTMFRRQGFKLRPHGLSWDLQNRHVFGIETDKKLIKTYYFNYSWEEAIALLGLAHGPDLYRDQQSLYQAVVKCEGFGKSLYSREGMNRKNWDRDVRRPIYNDFIQLVDSLSALPESPALHLDKTVILREQGVEADALLTAADKLLSRTLSKRLVIPPPAADEYSEFPEIQKRTREAFTPLELLVLDQSSVFRKVRQLSPERAIYR
jgi:hypothetical protein